MNSAYPITYRLAMVSDSPHFHNFCRSHGLFSYPTHLQGQGHGQGLETLNKCPRTRSILCINLVSLPLMVKSTGVKVVFALIDPVTSLICKLGQDHHGTLSPKGEGPHIKFGRIWPRGYRDIRVNARTDALTHLRTDAR